MKSREVLRNVSLFMSMCVGVSACAGSREAATHPIKKPVGITTTLPVNALDCTITPGGNFPPFSVFSANAISRLAELLHTDPATLKAEGIFKEAYCNPGVPAVDTNPQVHLEGFEGSCIEDGIESPTKPQDGMTYHYIAALCLPLSTGTTFPSIQNT